MSKPKKRKSTGAPIASAASRWLGDAAAERDLERELGPREPPKTEAEARERIEALVIELGGRVVWAGQRDVAETASGGAEPQPNAQTCAIPPPPEQEPAPTVAAGVASLPLLAPEPPAPTITPLAPALEGLAHIRDDVTGRCKRCGMRVNEDCAGYCLH